MNPLDELETQGIPVTWTTVALGLDGPGSGPPQIDLSNVRSWLDTRLSRGDDLPGAIDVLLAVDNDDGEARRLISAYANPAREVRELELRKWQSVMLDRELQSLPEDPFYAALSLADFWSQFDDDPDQPRPSGQELVSPLTTEDRQRLVGVQRSWLVRTRQALTPLR